MKEPLVSVIILNYNGENDLIECFNSLKNVKYQNVELILVDNGSSDNSIEIVRNKYEDVRIIELGTNTGFSLGNNLGVLRANGDYIALLNMDTVVDENWLTELVITAQKTPKIGVVASKIYYYNEKNVIDYAGSTCDIYGNTAHVGAENKDNNYLNQQRMTFYACGASLLFKKELYNKIGLFDPLYYMYYEDVDFSWRTWICGYEVVYTPKSHIYHKINRVRHNFPRIIYMTQRNKLRTLLKNYELKTLLRILPNYFFMRLWEIFTSREYKKYILFILYFKGFFWNILHIKSLIQNRSSIQNTRVRDDKFLFSLMKNLICSLKNNES